MDENPSDQKIEKDKISSLIGKILQVVVGLLVGLVIPIYVGVGFFRLLLVLLTLDYLPPELEFINFIFFKVLGLIISTIIPLSISLIIRKRLQFFSYGIWAGIIIFFILEIFNSVS